MGGNRPYVYHTKTGLLAVCLSNQDRGYRLYVYHTKIGLPTICLSHQDGEILSSVFPNSKTSEFASLLYIVPLMLNVKQGSCEYQFLNHWFDSTQNRTSSVLIQNQMLYPTWPFDQDKCRNTLNNITSVRNAALPRVLSALLNGTTSELASLFSSLSFQR